MIERREGDRSEVAMNLITCIKKGIDPDGDAWSNAKLARKLDVDKSTIGHWRTGTNPVSKEKAVRLFCVLAGGQQHAWYIEHLKRLGKALEEEVNGIDNQPLRQELLDVLGKCDAPIDWVHRERERMKFEAPADVFWAPSELPIDECRIVPPGPNEASVLPKARSSDQANPILAMLLVTIVALVVIAFLVLIWNSNRLDESEQIVTEFENSQSDVGRARRAVSEILIKYSDGSIPRLHVALINATPEVREAELTRFAEVIIRPRLTAEFEEIIRFFDRVHTCIVARDCDAKRTGKRLGPYADRFWVNFGALIRAKRDQTGTVDYGLGLQEIAKLHPGRN